MSDSDTSAPELERRRLSVAGAESELRAIISLEARRDGRINMTVGGTGSLKPLRAALNNLSESLFGKAQNDLVDVDQTAEQVTKALQDAGYTIQLLPASDLEIEAVFDYESGHLFSRLKPLHRHVEPLNDISGSINRALREGFEDLGRHALKAISEPLAQGDHAAAAVGLETAANDGILLFANSETLDAALKIDANVLDVATAKTLRQIRLALATKLKRYGDGEADATILLNFGFDLTPAERSSIENVLGVILQARGAREAAIGLWRKVTAGKDIKAAERAWAWRNLSLALPPHEPETARAARASADAFLEAGAKRDAVTSLLQLCEILKWQSPTDARVELERLPALIDRPGLLAQVERGTLHHTIGKRFLELRNASRARIEAETAVELLRGIQGVEEQLISSLNLAAITSESGEDTAASIVFRTEAEHLVRTSGSPYFQLGARISALMHSFDDAESQAVVLAARASCNPELWVSAELAVALNDPALHPSLRLARIESLHKEIVSSDGDAGLLKIVALAIATLLEKEGDPTRAAIWLRRVLSDDPGALDARDMLVQVLSNNGKWKDLAEFLKSQIDRQGEMPGLLTVYAHALLNAGDGSAAITAVKKALKLLPHDDDRRVGLLDLRDRAFDLDGTLEQPAPPALPEGPVLREHLDQTLSDYEKYISGTKRMTFWNLGEPKKHVWISNPEQHSQTLLHTFLIARFGARIEVFEEVGAGAGRLDLLIRLQGGLKAVIELKMCGFGYSSTYASAGEDQVHHYMKARNVHLGYLVVHDARLDTNAVSLLSPSDDVDTVREILIDVRPRVSARGHKQNLNR